MQNNDKLEEMCLADNKIGADVIALMSGRLRGSITQIANSVRSQELNIPAIHRIVERRKPKK